MKHYAGLDISMKSTSICVVDNQGKIILETACPTQPDDIAKELHPFITSLDIVGLEAGAMSFWLVDELRKHDLPAACLDSRQIANVLSTIINKTDKNDARGIAQILRSKFYSVIHQRSKKSIEIGLLMTVRSGLVSDRTRKKNRIRGVLKSYGIRIQTSGNNSFVEQVKTAIGGLTDTARHVIEVALEDYAFTEKGIGEMELHVRQAERENPVISLLKTVHGIGPITALSFMAEVDDPARFKADPRKIGAYIGLTPRQYSSGETIRLGGISRSGSPALRALLYEAAVVLLTKTKNWSKLKSWGLRLSKRMPFKKAATAVARKLAVIMIKMWLSEEAFRFSDQKEKTSRKKKNLPISSEQPRPIIAEPPGGLKAKPCGLAALGLDPHPACSA